MKKNKDVLDRVWEQLILSVICEEFAEPDVVGVALSVRKLEDAITVWHKNTDDKRATVAIGEKLRDLLHLQPSVVVSYKSNKNSINDGSTYINADNFVVTDKSEGSAEQQQQQHNALLDVLDHVGNGNHAGNHNYSNNNQHHHKNKKHHNKGGNKPKQQQQQAEAAPPAAAAVAVAEQQPKQQ